MNEIYRNIAPGSFASFKAPPNILAIVLRRSLGARTAVQALQPNSYTAPFPNALVILSSPAWNRSFWCYQNQYAPLFRSNRLFKAVLHIADFFHIDKSKFLIQALNGAEAPLFKGLTPQANCTPQNAQKKLEEIQPTILLLATQAKADRMAAIWKCYARYLLPPIQLNDEASSSQQDIQLIELSNYSLHVLTYKATDGGY